ncbi:MAG: hypothetical protein KAS04_02290, partial [Candidatus Aenigmarchaeota archaeon]|nr:hypothetical protein [Candidatus Aenigmarchaeota archaeon]
AKEKDKDQAPAQEEKAEETATVGTGTEELDLSVWEDKDNWFKKRGGDGKTTGFGKFVRDNLDAFGFLSEELQEEILAKWKRTYPETDFPAIPAPKISSEKKTEEPAPQTTLDVLKSEILTDDEKFDHCADEIRNRESLTQLSSWAEVNSDKAGSVLPEAMFNDLCKIFKEREELLVGPENEDEEPAEKEQEVECPNDNSMVLLSKCDVEGVCNMRKGCPAHY